MNTPLLTSETHMHVTMMGMPMKARAMATEMTNTMLLPRRSLPFLQSLLLIGTAKPMHFSRKNANVVGWQYLEASQHW
jgi:hypothetical protein